MDRQLSRRDFLKQSGGAAAAGLAGPAVLRALGVPFPA